MFASKRFWLVSVVVLMAIAVTVGRGPRVEAQSGTRVGGATEIIPQPTFEQKLWDYLKSARYENWAPIPGRSDDFYPGQSPHGDFLKLYVNRSSTRKLTGRQKRLLITRCRRDLIILAWDFRVLQRATWTGLAAFECSIAAIAGWRCLGKKGKPPKALSSPGLLLDRPLLDECSGPMRAAARRK
jgi:hypothetical protein